MSYAADFRCLLKYLPDMSRIMYCKLVSPDDFILSSSSVIHLESLRDERNVSEDQHPHSLHSAYNEDHSPSQFSGSRILPFSQVVCVGKIDWCLHLKDENSRHTVSCWVLINASVNCGVGNVA